MKNLVTKNEGVITFTLGLVWVGYRYISNGYKFDGYPNGAILILVGLMIISGKYISKRGNMNKD